MKINSIVGFNIHNTQDRKKQTNPNINFMATPPVPKTLERFASVWHDILPVTLRDFFDNIKNKSKYSPLQALGAAFIGLLSAKNVQEVKEAFPQECDENGLFNELKDYRDTKATSGILSVYRENKESYPDGILKNGRDITVYLLQKLYIEAKNRKEINQDLDNDLNEDFKNKFNQKYSDKKSKYISTNTLLRAFGIKRLDPAVQTSLRYIDEEYRKRIALLQSEAQKEAWRNLTPEKKIERRLQQKEKYRKDLEGLSEAEIESRLKERAGRIKNLSPEEITELIERLRKASIRSRFAMLDAWNHSEFLLKEMSVFLRERQIYKPLDLLFSDEDFKDYQSMAMTDFWDTHRDLAEEFGRQVTLSYQKVDKAIENGNFEDLQKEILRQTDARKEKFKQDKLTEDQNKLTEEQDNFINRQLKISGENNARPSEEEFDFNYQEYRDDFRKAYSRYANRNFILPQTYAYNMADIVLTSSSKNTVEKIIELYNAKSDLPADLSNALEIKPDNKNYEKAIRLQRALEASIARELYPKVDNPDIFGMEYDELMQFYKDYASENYANWKYPDISRIDNFYLRYKADLSESELYKIVNRYFVYRTDDDAKLIADYIRTYGRSALVLFSDKSVFSNEVKTKFNEKFLRLMPEEVKNGCIPVYSSPEDIIAEPVIQKIRDKIEKKYDFMPKDFIKIYSDEVVNTIHEYKNSTNEEARQIYSIKSFEDKVCNSSTVFEDENSTYYNETYIVIPKTSLSRENLIKTLAAEQAVADELVRITGKDCLNELPIEILMNLFEVLSSKKYDGIVYATKDNIKIEAQEKAKKYNIKPNYEECISLLKENADEIFDGDNIKDINKLAKVLNPEPDNIVNEEYIKNRIKDYLKDYVVPTPETIPEKKNLPEKETYDETINEPENDKKTILRNAFRKSGLMNDFVRHETSKKSGNKWSMVKEVMQKGMKPGETPYSTPNLIDAFLVKKYIKGYRDYRGGNPLKLLNKEAGLSESKIKTLISVYKGIKLSKYEQVIMQQSGFAQFRKTVNIEAMTKSIEDMEAQYKESFFNYFWNSERIQRLSDALRNETIELSNDVYKTIENEIFNV